MKLEFHELRIMKAIVDEGGFSKAAQKLGLSQSAVSQTLANLEHKLEATLIERQQPLLPTEPGKRLLQFATSLLHEEQQVLNDLKQIKSGIRTTLSVIVNSTIEQYHATALLESFLKTHPLSKIKLDILPSREIIDAVLADRAELGFGPFQSKMNAFDTVPLFHDRHRLMIAKTAPYYPVTKTNLASIPLLTGYLDENDQPLNGPRIRQNFKTIWQVGSMKIRMDLVKRGLGIAYISEQLMQNNADNLVFVDQFPFSLVQRVVGVYSKKQHILSAGARDFIDLCTARWQNI